MTIDSIVDSCFILLATLSNTNNNNYHHYSSSSSGSVNKVSLDMLLNVLRLTDTPLYEFMTVVHGVDLNALAKDLDPRSQHSSSSSASSDYLGRDEFGVVVRILCSAAQKNSSSPSQQQQKVAELLHVSITLAVSSAAMQLARSVKEIVAESVLAGAAAHTPSTKHHHIILAGGGEGNDGEFQIQNFTVDFDFILRLSHAVQTAGSIATAQKVIKLLEQQGQVQLFPFMGSPSSSSSSSSPAGRSSPPQHHNNSSISNVHNNIFSLSREASNMWFYALDERQSTGGMNDGTRAELVAAALEATGREVFPACESAHVAAQLALQTIIHSF